MADDNEELLDPAEIAALMKSAIGVLPSPGANRQIDDGSCQSWPERSEIPGFAGVDLEAALSNRLAEARPFELPSFDLESGEADGPDQTTPCDADVELQIELGRAYLPSDEGDALREGAVIPLDKLAGDPVDILVEGRLIARGEVLVLNDKLCVRIAEIIGSSFGMETRAEMAHA